MKRRAGTVAAIVIALMLAAFAVVNAHGTVDQTSGPSQVFTAANVGFSEWGQEFVPTATNIVALDLDLSSPAPLTDSITITIYEGSLAGPIVGSETHSVTTTTAFFVDGLGEIVHIDLTVPIPVTAGSLHVLGVRSDSNDRFWLFSFLDSYPLGDVVIGDDGLPGADFTFTTYFGGDDEDSDDSDDDSDDRDDSDDDDDD